MKKLNLRTLLGITQHGVTTTENALKNSAKTFKNDGSRFEGVNRTYNPEDGQLDEPSKRKSVRIVETVDENLQYLQNTIAEHLTNQFNKECTNAQGHKVPVVINNKVYNLSSLEIMNLKSFLSNPEFKNVISSVPVRDGSENWQETTNAEYKGKGIYELPLRSNIKTQETVREKVILVDPNVANLKPGVTAPPSQTTEISRIILRGIGTEQHFSGKWSEVQRAELKTRVDKLILTLTKALEECNNVDVVESELKGDDVLDYLFKI